VGSTVHDLQKLAISIFQICITANVALKVAWALNFTADHFSKVFDFDDWSINKYISTFFESRWGPHTCDRFANKENKNVEKFNSQFWCPGMAGVDAFAYDWSHDINWLVPPVYLIPQVLKYMRNCKANGIMTSYFTMTSFKLQNHEFQIQFSYLSIEIYIRCVNRELCFCK
jgi:hypothetical protein